MLIVNFILPLQKELHMHYITVDNISKSYGEVTLFENLSFSIHKDQKIGLLAKNGSGKTTILNILAGLDTPDTGEVVFRNGITKAYLPQEPVLKEQLTIEETLFAQDNKYIQAINAYHAALENPEDEKQYQKAFETMERLNAWDYETHYKQILFKLQLDNLKQPVKTLSGGQRRRLAMANALINKPDVLILDEPTNHLDLEMIEWLEAYFAKEAMTLFMVTHDRYFLERVCNDILDLDHGKLYNYKGNYAYYLENKEARQAQFETETNKAKQLYLKELEWMRRQPKARTTKSKSRIDDFHVIKQRAHERRKEHTVQLEINMERLGSKVIEFHKVSKAFGEKPLLKGFDYVFKTGERVGIIGKNGTGKSTFLNLITGQTEPDNGKIIIGDTVKFGYYTQKGIAINPGEKVIEVIRKYGDYIPLMKGRQISAQQLLERFLFDRKKQYDYVEKLSGGEQKRLYLCTILIQNPNVLILDEPTNDLDIVTLNVLESFLLDFPGCLLVVSHDRYFMDKIVDHLFVFQGEGVIEDFPGNYTDYRVYEDSLPPTVEDADKKEKKQWKKDANSRLSYNEQKEYNNLESKIKALEHDRKEIEAQFHNPDLSSEAIQELSLKLQGIIDQINEKEERWFELTEKMEE